MKIEYKSISEAINQIKIESGEEIKVNGLTHLLFLCPLNEGQPAEFIFPSDMVNGCDIYIWDSIPLKFKRPVILHEIVEVTNRYDPISKRLDENRMESHKIAREFDVQYARETLDGNSFREYLDFQRQMEQLFNKLPNQTL